MWTDDVPFLYTATRDSYNTIAPASKSFPFARHLEAPEDVND